MYKVTRTWYVEADKAVEAIEKSSRYEHDEVESLLLKGTACPTCGEEIRK